MFSFLINYLYVYMYLYLLNVYAANKIATKINFSQSNFYIFLLQIHKH